MPDDTRDGDGTPRPARIEYHDDGLIDYREAWRMLQEALAPTPTGRRWGLSSYSTPLEAQYARYRRQQMPLTSPPNDEYAPEWTNPPMVPPDVDPMVVPDFPVDAVETSSWDDSEHHSDVPLGTPTIPETCQPASCACADCARRVTAMRRMEDERRAEEARVVTARRAAEAYALSHRDRVCRECAYAALPTCPRCGRCSWQAATAEEQALHETHRGISSDNFSRINGRPMGCCRCTVCLRCNTNFPRGSTSLCPQGQHIGCSCDCVTCQCGVVLSARQARNACRRADGNFDVCVECEGVLGHCCSCRRCLNCNTTVRRRGNEPYVNYCFRCELCTGCCGCIGERVEQMIDRNSPPVGSGTSLPIFQRPPLKKWFPSPTWGHRDRAESSPAMHPDGLTPVGLREEVNPYSRLIGHELEFASHGTWYLNKVVVKDWHGAIVQDGSLPSTGFEINLSPAAGDMYVKQIHEVCAELARTGALLTNACGMHVHVDTSDFKIWDMRRLVNLYRRVEPAMYSLLSPTRHNNHFCIPCGESWWETFNDASRTRELKTRVLTTLYGRGSLPSDAGNETAAQRKAQAAAFKKQKSAKSNGMRYRALNVHSWFLRGTLEFRHAEGMKDERSVRNWGLVCASVVEAAMRMSDVSVARLDYGYKTLRALLPTEDVKLWADERRKSLGTNRDPCSEPLRDDR